MYYFFAMHRNIVSIRVGTRVGGLVVLVLFVCLVRAVGAGLRTGLGQAVHVRLQLDQVEPGNGCQLTFREARGLKAEDLYALAQVLLYLLLGWKMRKLTAHSPHCLCLLVAYKPEECFANAATKFRRHRTCFWHKWPEPIAART